MDRRIVIRNADRGVVIEWEEGDGPCLEVIEGRHGSTNLRDRVRRRACEIVARWFPVQVTDSVPEPATDAGFRC